MHTANTNSRSPRIPKGPGSNITSSNMAGKVSGEPSVACTTISSMKNSAPIEAIRAARWLSIGMNRKQTTYTMKPMSPEARAETRNTSGAGAPTKVNAARPTYAPASDAAA